MKLLVIRIIIFLCIATTNLCYAEGSSSIGPQTGLIPYSLQSYVDTNNCTLPIQSSPYVIVSGNGGANMRLSCPADKPVMYGWRQVVGFGGFMSVQAGGGASWITCCAVGHKWVPSAIS